MITFDNKADKVKSYFADKKVELYKLSNPLLAVKNEYIKSLYLRMLCVLIGYTSEASDMQILYVRRILNGIKATKDYNAYMKMAINIETQDINEFIDAIKDDDLKYYFCIDGIILLSISNSTNKQYRLLADIIELTRICSEELKYLSLMAKAIIKQDSNEINEVLKIAPITMVHLSFFHYLVGFYQGAIANFNEEYHIYSPNRGEVVITSNNQFSHKRVIVENITSFVVDEVKFNGCEEVIIKNCTLYGNSSCFIFENVGKIRIEKCTISGFSNRFGQFIYTNNIEMIDNEFLNCGVTNTGNVYGGVANIKGSSNETIILENNKLRNCYVARCSKERNSCATGIFLGGHWSRTKRIEVVGNSFIGCKCINNGEKYKDNYIALGVDSHIEGKNIFIGDVKNIF